MPDTLEHPDFQALDELSKAEAARALADPEQYKRVLLTSVLALRQEQRDAGRFCLEECRPETQRRLSRLERFKVWLIGLGAGIGALLGLFSALWAIFKGGG